MERKYTLDTFVQKMKLTSQSALNSLSKLKRQGYVTVSGGGRQKRIYTLSSIPQVPTNGFYDLVNKYSPEKLVPKFKHHVVGRYTVEQAIIDGIEIGDVRTLSAAEHLFRHVHDWKKLFDLAKKHQVANKLRQLYSQARKHTKVKTMPKRYRK